MRNPLFGVFFVLMAMLALICALFVGTKALAPDEEIAGTQGEREEIFCATIDTANHTCAVFRRFDGLLTYTEVGVEEYDLDADSTDGATTTTGVLNTRSREAEHGPLWVGGWGGGDQDGRLLPALA